MNMNDFIIFGVVVLWSNIGLINKTAVEEASSEATKAKVTLNEIHILADGKGAIRGFLVGNPAGFETPSAFKLGEVSVSLDIGPVSSDTVRIH